MCFSLHLSNFHFHLQALCTEFFFAFSTITAQKAQNGTFGHFGGVNFFRFGPALCAEQKIGSGGGCPPPPCPHIEPTRSGPKTDPRCACVGQAAGNFCIGVCGRWVSIQTIGGIWWKIQVISGSQPSLTPKNNLPPPGQQKYAPPSKNKHPL